MNRIESHIENLLLKYECVIVPGLGGFVTRFEESFFSEDGNELFPPYRSVSFNSQLRTNDGLLTQSYMTAYDTSYPKAHTLVSEDAQAIREQLYKTNEYVFGTLGKLQLTQSNALIFIPADETGIFSKELYGLSICSPISKIKSNEIVETAATVMLSSDVQTKKTTEQHVTNTKRENRDTHYIVRISRSAVHYTVATIAAAILYFIFTIAPSVNPIDNNLQQAGIISTPTKKTNDVSVIKSKVVVENSEQSPDSIRTITAPASLSVEEDNQIQQTNVAPTETYTIVLASAIGEAGANAIINDLKECHFGEARFIHDGNMTRVIYSSFSTEKEASRALKALRMNHKRFERAWIKKGNF